MKTPLRILYVEDEADIRAVTEFALEDEGILLCTCASGQEALERGPGFLPDLILIDVMMPGLDGPATLGLLREAPPLSGVPVIFMTAKVQPSELEWYKALGALGVIRKPFEALNLASEIRSILAGGQPDDSRA